MDNSKHEDIGWPTPLEEAALDRAAIAGAAALKSQTDADRAELARRCAAAEAYRLAQQARSTS
jgi:hypothetical protein